MTTRSLFRGLGLLCAVLLSCHCQKAPSLTLTSSSDLVVEAGGGTATLTFTTNTDWTIRADSWIHVTPFSGAASKKALSVTATVDANTASDRSGRITISAGEVSETVTVRQEALYFRVLSDELQTPSTLMIDRNGVGPNLKVETNAAADPSTWSVTCSEPWCFATAGGYPVSISLSAEAYGKNDPLWPRTCELSVVIPGLYNGTFKVVQESVTFIELAGGVAEEYILSPSGAAKEFTIHTNLYEWKVENGSDWIKAEKVDAMTFRVSAIPRTQASSAARNGTIHLYSAALSHRPSTAGDFITLNFKEGDPDVSGEDYGYGESHGWD
jgi:hypothetical protein